MGVCVARQIASAAWDEVEHLYTDSVIHTQGLYTSLIVWIWDYSQLSSINQSNHHDNKNHCYIQVISETFF